MVAASWPQNAELSCIRSGSGLQAPLAPEPGKITAYSGCQSPRPWKHPLCRATVNFILSGRDPPCPTAVIGDGTKEKLKRI